MERIVISKDSKSFIYEQSGLPFHPWGLNYGNAGRLIEDFWDTDWKVLTRDFQKMKQLGANVVRIHLQFGKFMASSNMPNPSTFQQLFRLVRLAEKSGLYLDLTGLACYRPSDTPKWYDAVDETIRWKAQAAFWSEVARTCASSPAVFCYDLMNEPLSPAGKRDAEKWGSGSLLGGYDFLQFISLDSAGRKREEIAIDWIHAMKTAVRAYDTNTLITVGLLPWTEGWNYLSGFLPEQIAPELDFLSVHIYPDMKKPGEGMEALRKCAIGKPVVIEETFPLYCSSQMEEEFLRKSKESPWAGWATMMASHLGNWTASSAKANSPQHRPSTANGSASS